MEAVAAALGYIPIEPRLTFVDFQDEGLLGLHQSGKILVARKELASISAFVSTLVHEVAHDKGPDGNKNHERAEGDLFGAIIQGLIG